MSTIAPISYDQYEEMIRRGDFPPDDPRRFELIEGELIEMTAPNPPHNRAIDILVEWSFENLPRRALWIRGQQALGIPALASLPLPDLTWVRRENYAKRHPQPADVLLIVEISETSLSYDRNTKARLYAAAGLADYWIVNLRGECFEILREPGARGYQSKTILYPGETVAPLAYPDLHFPVSLIFPES